MPALGADKKHGPGKKPGKGGGRPPAGVLVQVLREGLISPDADFTGTIRFRTVSEIAAETDGKVRSVTFEEGRRVKKGALLVSLSAERLRKDIAARKASHAEVMAELEKAESDLRRAETLYKKELLPAKDFDQYRFAVQGLKSRARSIEAEMERLKIELSYKEVRAPFGGVVLEKKVEPGEWVNPGTVVATLADDSVVDLIVNVPQKALPFIKTGLAVKAAVGQRNFKARVFSLIPRGDVRTRTFPVKIRIENGSHSLGDGMEAHVRLPIGRKVKTLLINRDALTSFMGQTAVFAAIDGKAVMMPVRVTGYKGQLAGITAAMGPGLRPGMKIVVKGNERLRPGQPVMIINGMKKRRENKGREKRK